MSAVTVRCAKQVWVPVGRGARRYRVVSCRQPGTVAVQWGPRRELVCPSCAAELCDGYLIQACRLPDGDQVAALTNRDIEQIRAVCTRIAGRGGVRFITTRRGITAVVRHWGRQGLALRVLRALGFEALQPSDNPTVRVVARRTTPRAATGRSG
jgi:hypothetical protein